MRWRHVHLWVGVDWRVRSCWENLTYFVENLASLSQTGKTGCEERDLFIGARTKDVPQRLYVAFFLVLPEVRVGDGYILSNH